MLKDTSAFQINQEARKKRIENCVRCYENFRERNKSHMEECDYFKEFKKIGVTGDVCFYMKSILSDIKKAFRGIKVEQGITNVGILKILSEKNIEKIPLRVYTSEREMVTE